MDGLYSLQARNDYSRVASALHEQVNCSLLDAHTRTVMTTSYRYCYFRVSQCAHPAPFAWTPTQWSLSTGTAFVDSPSPPVSVRHVIADLPLPFLLPKFTFANEPHTASKFNPATRGIAKCDSGVPLHIKPWSSQFPSCKQV